MTEIRQISIKNENYPEILKKIKNPPPVIYVKGKLFSKENCFAIVGTRHCSSYGKQIAWEIAMELSNAGLTIVSGLAPGIDTIVHRSVLQNKQRTIAVLGTGLDESSIYPKENIKLARQIVKSGGALISEYPPKTKGSKFTFPQRNRIISGLSLGVLVIEAKERSGALITAQWAKKQKREIFAIPGSIYSLNSRGCHYLIKNGAQLTENASDILRKFNLSVKKTNIYPKGENKEESIIIEALKQGGLEIDKIIEKTCLDSSKVISLLTKMEAQGKIINIETNIYALNPK